VECIAGAEVGTGESGGRSNADQSLLLTLVGKGDHRGSRILALMFGNRDLRNSVMSGLRILSTDANFVPRVNNPASAAVGAAKSKADAQQQPQRAGKRMTVREVVLEEKLAQAPSSPSPRKAGAAEVTLASFVHWCSNAECSMCQSPVCCLHGA
jgi:hypothetical protein